MTVNLPTPPARLRAFVLIAFFCALGLGEGLSQGLLVAVLVTALWAGVSERFVRLRELWVLWPVRLLAAFCLWHMAVAPFAPFPSHALHSAGLLLNFAGLLAIPALLTASEEPVAVTALVVGVAVSAAYGVAQYFFGLSFGAELFGVSPSRWQVPVPNDPTHFVASGFFYNRLKLAHVLVSVVLFAGALLSGLTRLRKQVLSVLLAVACAALLLTFARAAVFALALAAIVTLVVRARTRGARVGWPVVATLALIVVLGAGVAWLVPAVRLRLSSAFSASSYDDRLFLWARAKEIIHDYPWFGVGWHNYAKICPLYYDRVDAAFVMRTEAHNQFLTIWAEGGPMALLLWLGFLLTLGRELVRRLVTSPPAAGAFAVLVAMMGLSFLHDVFFHPIVTVTVFALFGWGLMKRPRAAE